MSVIAIVPAAGASSRFGSMKLLADIAGTPLLAHTLGSLLAAPVDRVVVVVSPEHALASVTLLRDSRVSLVTNPDPGRGMFSSVQSGLAVMDDALFLVQPADMPYVPASVIARLVGEAQRLDLVVVPTYGGKRGHPVGIPGRLRPALLAAPPTSTLKQALADAAGTTLHEVPVDDIGVVHDVDVPSDLRTRVE